MKIIRLDSQVLTSYSHCPLRCNYAFIERLQPAEDNPFFAMGKVVHIALQEYYTLLKKGIGFNERFQQAIVSANTHAVTETCLEGKNLEKVLKALEDYFKYRREDKILVKEIEVPFSFVLYEGLDLMGEPITILYEGIIDLYAEEDGTNLVYDHKTTSKWSMQNPVDLRVQFIGYTKATGCDVVHNRFAFNEKLAPSERFKKFRFKYHPVLIERWEKYAIMKGLEYARSLETNVWPDDFSACEGSHGYACTYAPVCRHPTMADETKEYLYRIGEAWDVFKEKNT